MRRDPRGFALAVALAALAVLGALASLAQLSANLAVRESVALRASVQDRVSRAVLDARLDLRLTTLSRGALLDHPVSLGARDTVLSLIPLAWPWHRAVVTIGGVPIVAEAVRASAPTLPWCAAAVVAGHVATSGAFVAAPGAGCPDTLWTVPAAEISAADSAMAADLSLGAVADTIFITANDVAPAVHVARVAIEVAAGCTVLGVLEAPVVRIGPLASVRGIVVARDSLNVGAGASVEADPAVAREAIFWRAALHPVGRRGLLLPP